MYLCMYVCMYVFWGFYVSSRLMQDVEIAILGQDLDWKMPPQRPVWLPDTEISFPHCGGDRVFITENDSAM